MRFVKEQKKYMADIINIEICYATPKEYFLEKVSLPAGSTVLAAIEMSRVLERFQEIDLTENKIGVFGELVSLSSVLVNGDRVEIYRPLPLDPKSLRQQRAKSKKAKERAERERISRKSQKLSENDQ